MSGYSRLATGRDGSGSAQISGRSKNFYCLNVKVPMLCSTTVGVPPYLERPWIRIISLVISAEKKHRNEFGRQRRRQRIGMLEGPVERGIRGVAFEFGCMGCRPIFIPALKP